MKRQAYPFVFTTMFLVTPGWPHGDAMSQTVPAHVPALRPGLHVQTLQSADDLRIRYAIFVPETASRSEPVPLILALHYGGNPNGAALGVLRTLVAPALAELGAVIVAPESAGGGWSTAANDRAVIALLDAVEAAYGVDRRKVAVTGFSMGGSGAWQFAARYPQRFSAVVPVAGTPPSSPAGWRTPVFAIHSRDDEVVPIARTELRVEELRAAGVEAEFIALDGISHYETHRFVGALRRAVPWLRQIWR